MTFVANAAPVASFCSARNCARRCCKYLICCSSRVISVCRESICCSLVAAPVIRLARTGALNGVPDVK